MWGMRRKCFNGALRCSAVIVRRVLLMRRVFGAGMCRNHDGRNSPRSLALAGCGLYFFSSMPKRKNVQRSDPLETYDFDFEKMQAYMFPNGWSANEKKKFRALSNTVKRERCIMGGGGSYFYNGHELKIMWIPKSILETAAQSSQVPENPE
jgi:hypothetical protein